MPETYKILMNELAELLKSKNNEIRLLKWQVEDLKAKLEIAEAHLPTKQTLEIRANLNNKELKQ